MRKAIAVIYGGLCHGLFVAGVAMMIWQMYFGMSRCFGTLAWPWSIAANALLILQFPIAHSLLLTGRGRMALTRLAPRSVGRDMAPTSFVIVASLQTLLLFSMWTPSGTVWWQAAGFSQFIFNGSIWQAGCCWPGQF